MLTEILKIIEEVLENLKKNPARVEGSYWILTKMGFKKIL